MELSNVGDRVFAAERILKKRKRRVGYFFSSLMISCILCYSPMLFLINLQGQAEYLVKWKGWSTK